MDKFINNNFKQGTHNDTLYVKDLYDMCHRAGFTNVKPRNKYAKQLYEKLKQKFDCKKYVERNKWMIDNIRIK